MFTGTQSIFIPVKREQVFAAAKTYPLFVRFFDKKSKITSETETAMAVEVHTKLLGFFQTRWMGEGIKKEPDQISFLQTQGLFKGLNAVWIFEDKNNGTIVKIQTTFSKPKLPRRFEQWLGLKVVEYTAQKVLLELKRECLESISLDQGALRR